VGGGAVGRPPASRASARTARAALPRTPAPGFTRSACVRARARARPLTGQRKGRGARRRGRADRHGRRLARAPRERRTREAQPPAQLPDARLPRARHLCGGPPGARHAVRLQGGEWGGLRHRRGEKGDGRCRRGGGERSGGTPSSDPPAPCPAGGAGARLPRMQLFTRRAAASIFSNQRLQRWCFDVELVYVAQRLGVPISGGREGGRVGWRPA
jgi:hypothetical protein